MRPPREHNVPAAVFFTREDDGSDFCPSLWPPCSAFPDNCTLPQPNPSFTLEQVMSAPFVSEHNGGSCRRACGVDRKYRRPAEHLGGAAGVARGSHASAQQITHYDADDGQEISGLAWSADGEWLAYTHGGDSEWPERPAPNPALLTAGVKQEVWLISATAARRAISARAMRRRSRQAATSSRIC